MREGFVKVAAASPDLKVADPLYNAGEIVDLIRKAESLGVKVLVFPELSITGYTCGDLFFQKSLQRAADDALKMIIKDSASSDALVFVGYPYLHKGKLFNTAAVIKSGRLLALIPKKNIPSYGEFYETRWFTPSPEYNEDVDIFGEKVIFGSNVIFDSSILSTLSIGCEICEDLWVPESPSLRLALNGATVIVNLSASDEIIGKEEYRRNLISSVSARLVAGYVYADAADGESTTDMVFTGSNIIAENGTILSSSIFRNNELTISEIDTDRLAMERERMNTFPSCSDDYDRIPISFREEETKLTRTFSPHPFVPSDENERSSRCESILMLQAYGLKKRLVASRSAKAVVGLSGGLDSTLALLVACKMQEIDPRFTVLACHCIHGLDADDPIWLKHCQDLCLRLKVKLVTPKLNIVYGNGVSPEDASRKERYRALLENLSSNGYLMLGHQADDQVENLLLALKRGSGPRGLGGMSAVTCDNRGTVVRPLLD